MFTKLPFLSIALISIGTLTANQLAFGEESENIRPLESDVVATCGTIDGYPSYGFAVARNNLGAYDVYIQNGDTGTTSVKRNWEGSAQQDSIYFRDPSQPSAGNLSAYRSDESDRLQGGIIVRDFVSLRNGRGIWCDPPQEPRTVISCINNVLNDPLHSVDIYRAGSSYQMKVTDMNGSSTTHTVYGRVESSRVWMSGSRWTLDVSWRPNFWWGSLKKPDGHSNDMVCFK